MKIMFFILSIFAANQLFAAPIMVDTNWLASNKNNKNLVIVDTSDQTQHLRFHIPGAIHIDYSEIVYKRKKDKVSIQVPNDYFIKLLGQRGIDSNSHVVIYDDMGGLNAGRLFWQLEQIGHKNISVLDGGLVKWILEHRKVNNKPEKRLPTVYQTDFKNARNNLAIQTELSKDNILLIDARTKDEYIGHPKYPRTGHVPGAQLWDWQENVNFENAFVLKTTQRITKEQNKINLKDKNKEVIAYCRSGHRAAQTYLTLRNLGFTNVKLYDGSMAEYSQNKKAPLEKGCSRC